MNTSLYIIPVDRVIGIGSTKLVGISTDMSWIPSDIHAVHWNGTSGEIEYNDGKPNVAISSIGIYSQAETTFNNELEILSQEPVYSTEMLWIMLRSRRDNLLTNSDWTQLSDVTLDNSKKAEWVTYRQTLRDLPSNTSDPENPTWPTQPT